MSFAAATRSLFDQLSEATFSALRQGESLNLDLYAEEQTYVRFNRARVRQATEVVQTNLGLTFQGEGRQLRLTMDLTGQPDNDIRVLISLLERARMEVRSLPEDPFIAPMKGSETSESQYAGEYPQDSELIAQIAAVTEGLDFAGLLSKGPQISAARNSAGQNHWFSTDSFFLDYSLYTVNDAGENQAVKGLYADRHWRWQTFNNALAKGKMQLRALERPARTIAPGVYRVFLEPAAMKEIMQMFSWGAVSYAAWKNGQSGLQKLIDGGEGFADRFNLKENFNLGLSPRFNSQSELAPMELPIIEQGQLKNLLVGSRTAKEYGVPSNGADTIGWSGEGLRSPEMGAGDMDAADALTRLGHGLYLGNLHYLNWSDLHTARITGMTRYACFWVENGEIVAPIHDVRFDESLYRIFGPALEAITLETQIFPSTDTYQQRALGGSKVPGALVGAFRFTL